MWYPIFNMIYRWENRSLDDIITADVYNDWDKYIIVVRCEKLNSSVCYDFDDLQVAIRTANYEFIKYYTKSVLDNNNWKWIDQVQMIWKR